MQKAATCLHSEPICLKLCSEAISPYLCTSVKDCQSIVASSFTCQARPHGPYRVCSEESRLCDVTFLTFVTVVTSIPRVCHYQESERARVHGTGVECFGILHDDTVPVPHPVSDPFMTEKPARQSVKPDSNWYE